MMKRYHGQTFNRRQGFTLVEVMIVVAILAILAAIAIPVYSTYVKDAKFAQAKSDLVLLSTLMERYYQNNNAYYGSPSPGTVLLPNTATNPTLLGWTPGTNVLFTFTVMTPDPGMPAACNAPAIASPSYLVTAAPVAAAALPNDVFYLDSANNRCEVLANGTVVVGW